MDRTWGRSAGWSLALASLTMPAAAQQAKAAPRPADNSPVPAIVGVNPPAAAVGASTEWVVNGRNLARVDRWAFSGKGIEVAEVRAQTETAATLLIRVAPDAILGVRELRAMGPAGLSNLALVRVDRLIQVAEIEPNDEASQATEVAIGTAVHGTIRPQDVDHYKLKGRPGARVTVEVEAQRLGTPVVPILTLFSGPGTAIAQAVESRGADHDARLSYTFADDAMYTLQVRDTLYGGGEGATYRLRIEEAPYATGLYPLGGPRGGTVEVTASGGNLQGPLSQSVRLPDEAGATVEVPPFPGLDGPVSSPGRLYVGAGIEVAETADGPTTLPAPAAANGRIGRRGEVDRYRVAVKKGDILGIRVRAAGLGSWLDALVAVVDDKGNVLAERDDLVEQEVQRNPLVAVNQAPVVVTTPDAADARLEYQAAEDGTLNIEVTDRYGEGGPEYAYRLEVGPEQPDFKVSLLLDPTIAVANNGRARRARSTAPGSTGALNLKRGTTTPINFTVSAEGKTGPITLTVEGLPPGTSATPVVVRPAVAANRGGMNQAPQVNAGNINIKVDSDAAVRWAEVRVVGRATPEQGPPLARTALGTVPMDTNPNNSPTARNVSRVLASLPMRILGEGDVDAATDVGPPAPVALRFKEIKVPGALLQGSRIELSVQLDPPRRDFAAIKVEVELGGKGLASQVVPPAPAGPSAAVVRILAAVDALPGNREVTIRVQAPGGEPISQTITLVVRPPIAVRPRELAVAIQPGGTAKLWVAVERTSPFSGPVDLRISDLPPGVTLTGPSSLKADEEGRELTLSMAADAAMPAGPTALKITGTARMPRGPVRVEAETRPSLGGRGGAMMQPGVAMPAAAMPKSM